MYAIITDRAEARNKGLLISGTYFMRNDTGRPLFLPIRYDNRINLELMVYFHYDDTSEEAMKCHTLTELLHNGTITEKKLYKEYEIVLNDFPFCGTRKILSPNKINDIAREFNQHGFNVNIEAIRHNYLAWVSDMKSGYRDTENGYHLFSPCGCNILRFSATTLFNESDWQNTYQV